jgi:glycosyltransferase involved in cell wall biosynthesis
MVENKNMKIAYYLKKLHLTGGTKVLMQHQQMLRDLGYETYWFVKEVSTDFDFEVPIVKIEDVSEISSYNIDVLVVNKPKDYFEVKQVKTKHLVYLSQAFEITHMEIRCDRKKKLPAYRSFLGRTMMDFKWWLKKRRIHRMYGEPTVKWCVSPYLMKVLKNYKCPTMLVRNSFDDKLYFKPSTKLSNPKPIILSVGDYALSRKNMPFLFEALANVKEDFYLIRVSPNPMTEAEKKSGLIDEFHSCIEENELASLYRKSDILLSTSTDEGFGLPPLEAMACEALCILSDIGAYRQFSDIADDAPKDYALFFDPYDILSLTNILDRVLKNIDDFESIRENGVNLSSYYTVDKTVSDLKKALTSLEI